MAKKVTIYDIADRLNLSPSTVSRALAGNTVINARTRAKVAEAAKEMGYTDTRYAQSTPDTLVVLVSDIDNPFYSNIIRAIQNRLGSRYLISIMSSNNSVRQEKEIVARLDPSHIKCLIISQSMDTDDSSHLEEAEKRGITEFTFFGHIGKLIKVAGGIFLNRAGDLRPGEGAEAERAHRVRVL